MSLTPANAPHTICNDVSISIDQSVGCAWCETAPGASSGEIACLMGHTTFPSAFVWTKMQAEAGQSLEAIIQRKELERASGGTFFWGIGNALGDNLRRLIAREHEPTVLFSIMRSRPKQADAAPDAVLLWSAYVDWAGAIRRMPPHALVLSRAATEGGRKRRHYALVCRATTPLRLETLGQLAAGHFRNLGSEAPTVGASQVTAVVEHGVAPEEPILKRGARVGPLYDVNMRAVLATPHFVRLARPLLLTPATRALVETLNAATMTAGDWSNFVGAIHARAESERDLSDDPQDDLFGPLA